MHGLAVDLFGPEQLGFVVSNEVGSREVAVRNGARQALRQR